jgi:hypothetical protein
MSLPVLACTTLTLSEAASPPVDPGALAHCASMTSADERLACYDSLSRPRSSAAPAAPAASKAPAASTAAKAGPQAAAAPAATANPAAPAAAAGAGGAPAAGAASAADAKSFGLTRHPPPAEEGPSQIHAKVTRIDADQWGHVRVSLDNGQAWTFDSFNPMVREGEAVTIKRGAIGSFLLTTAGHNTYRAVRAQ